MALTAIIYNRVMWGEELDDSSGSLVRCLRFMEVGLD